MLKMYHRRAHKGDSPQLWEENWDTNNFTDPSLVGQSNPVKPLFDRYALPGTSMLEGGCGQGQFVAYYNNLGVRVVGLDFAQATLRRLRATNETLMLCSGDVAALPFQDASFDLYYSGGVVEHFEGGAELALREARRVLRPNGVLLVSVPYINLLRRVLVSIKSRSWKFVARAEADKEEYVEGKQFFQYAYARREFEEQLRAVGFRVIGTQGYGILWGLYDVSLVQKLLERLIAGVRRRSRMNAASAEDTCAPASQQTSYCESNDQLSARVAEGSGLKRGWDNLTAKALSGAIIRRLAINEDDQVPMLGLGVRLMRLACGNMMMYVCLRNDVG